STIEKYCYENLESNCDIYGGLYQWNEMMQYVTAEDAQGICPEGWHIPSDAQWHALENSLATGTCDPSRRNFGCDPAGSKLAGSYDLWNDGNLRNHIDFNDSGFNSIPAGYRNADGSFSSLGSSSYLWSSSIGGSRAWIRNLNSSNSSVYHNYNGLADGFSVRCLQN
ncbi:MAG: FISUMP domain-containing protein, partial [Patescibacteria group bacterium]